MPPSHGLTRAYLVELILLLQMKLYYIRAPNVYYDMEAQLVKVLLRLDCGFYDRYQSIYTQNFFSGTAMLGPQPPPLFAPLLGYRT